MKALILAAALVLPSAAPAELDSKKEVCAGLASLSHTIMQAHQEGVPFSTVSGVIDKHYPEPQANSAVTSIALEAYDSPRYVTEGAQERAAADFRDRVHVECLQ